MAHAQRSAALADPAGKEPGDVPGRRRNLKRSALVVDVFALGGDYGRWAYHGKHVAPGTKLSALASTTLGWSASIWDFSGDTPVLK
ncbi:MAG: hypothetical protein II479_01595 [Bacteroidales bacterium]|nr:hypothetical protein [Bacteroidales bacterium]